MCTINSHFICIKKMRLCLKVRFVSFILIFEADKELSTYFIRCDMNDIRIPHALCIEKSIVNYIIGFREG